MKQPINRRAFLRLGAASGLAAGLPWRTAQGAATPVGVKHYVPLGGTGLNISDISFGASQLRRGEEHLVSHALAQGINYFDTADSYTGGASETVLGNALKGQRDQVVIASKTHVGIDARHETIMARLENSLRRLQTDHVDIYFNHAVNDLARLQNPEWSEFVERAKRQGKLRFTGMSGHAGHLVDCVNHAVEHELFDVLLLAHNFGQDPAFFERFTRSFDFVAHQPALPQAMVRARAKNIGVIAMKVLRGARLNDMRPFEQDGATYAQAAFKWALGSEGVDAAVISMTSTDKINEFLGASGQRQVTDQDLQLLEHYARLTDMTYCRHACNDCQGACPYNVPISDVLRTRMYATDYGNLDFARAEYQMLGNAAEACLACDGQPCQTACSHGLPINRLCGPTHLMLS